MIVMNYILQTVNQTEAFADPTAGGRTQTIESVWQVYEMQNKRQCGKHRSLVGTDRFMQTIDDRFQFYKKIQ